MASDIPLLLLVEEEALAMKMELVAIHVKKLKKFGYFIIAVLEHFLLHFVGTYWNKFIIICYLGIFLEVILRSIAADKSQNIAVVSRNGSRHDDKAKNWQKNNRWGTLPTLFRARPRFPFPHAAEILWVRARVRNNSAKDEMLSHWRCLKGIRKTYFVGE